MAKRDADSLQHEAPAGGWGSVSGMAQVLIREKPTAGVLDTLLHQNKPHGFMCTSCAWGKPKHPHAFEFCENGAKSTLWELTKDRCTPAFFAAHTLTELRTWQDFDLEMQGRLTEPMRYDAASDTYVACSWDEAFTGIGEALRSLDPKSVVFYASGKSALEQSYLYGLTARFYGNNNLPDSSNMCHETTSVSLKKVLGSPVGTCVLEDFETCDAIFYFGQNPGTNSPRFLHPLQEAVKRGCKIITFNPVREQGLVRFINPQSPVEMVSQHATELSHQYFQVRPGGDISAVLGLCKHIFDIDAERIGRGERGVLDRAFIGAHTSEFDAFVATVQGTSWEDIERESGLMRTELRKAADVYADARNIIAVYGMGLTQHVHGSQSVGMLVNLLLLGGHMGREGAGICPVRGHSNVQGQRTVGISEKPELVPLDKLATQFGFQPPRDKGTTTVEACEGIVAGTIKGFLSLGGNFVRAIPDRDVMEPAWMKQEITVYIATKLNHSHLMHGRQSYLLPCLARSEDDVQASGSQSVSMEDSFSHVHGSVGKRKPASEHLLSEVAIVCGIARHLLPARPLWRWDEWTADYAKIRDLIDETYHEEFHDFNARMFDAGGFYRGNPARERNWKTETGKARFTNPSVLSAVGIGDAVGRYHLITMRSNDQFNTTIYGFSDRLRGLEGSRTILLMNPRDIERDGLKAGDVVSLVGDAGDDTLRRVDGLTVTPFNLPSGCVGGYYPEMNPLMPLWYHDVESKTPAAKGVPVRICASPEPARQA